jgi:hypothetical protein
LEAEAEAQEQEVTLRVELEGVEALAGVEVLRGMPLIRPPTLQEVQEVLEQVMEAILAEQLLTILEEVGQVLVVLFSSTMEEVSPYKEAAVQAEIA